jgi:glycosyltransferase involved in cell wall biosynthesis
VRVLASSPGTAAGLGESAVVPISPPGVIGALTTCDNVRVGRALTHVLTNVATYDCLAEQLADWPADVIYERYSPFGIAGGAVAADLGIAHVLEVNASLAEEGARYRGQALQDAAEALEDVAFRNASLVLAVSHELGQQIVDRGADPRRVAVIPNGVDDDLFTPVGIKATADLEAPTVVGFVGSLKPWHGIEVLVDAFRQVASGGRFHLLVVGDGPRATMIKTLASDLPGRVTWLPSVPHERVPEYLRVIDVAVAPYPVLDRFYFSPLKILEYMATGRAIVASRIGQIPDLLDDGEAGMLVPPGDASALAHALERLAEDEHLRRSLGRRAAESAHAKHLWTHRVADITWLMTQIVDEETRCLRGATA